MEAALGNGGPVAFFDTSRVWPGGAGSGADGWPGGSVVTPPGAGAERAAVVAPAVAATRSESRIPTSGRGRTEPSGRPEVPGVQQRGVARLGRDFARDREVECLRRPDHDRRDEVEVVVTEVLEPEPDQRDGVPHDDE